MAADTFDLLPFIKDLTPKQRELLRPLFVACECHAGTVLFEQGDHAIFFYILVSGEVAIRFKPDDGQALTIAHVHDGDLVGWSAVIGRRVYTSAAICTEFTRLLRMRGSDLQNLREENPETGIMIIERLAALVAPRLQNSHPQVVALLEHSLRNGVHLEASKNG